MPVIGSFLCAKMIKRLYFQGNFWKILLYEAILIDYKIKESMREDSEYKYGIRGLAQTQTEMKLLKTGRKLMINYYLVMNIIPLIKYDTPARLIWNTS